MIATQPPGPTTMNLVCLSLAAAMALVAILLDWRRRRHKDTIKSCEVRSKRDRLDNERNAWGRSLNKEISQSLHGLAAIMYRAAQMLRRMSAAAHDDEATLIESTANNLTFLAATVYSLSGDFDMRQVRATLPWLRRLSSEATQTKHMLSNTEDVSWQTLLDLLVMSDARAREAAAASGRPARGAVHEDAGSGSAEEGK